MTSCGTAVSVLLMSLWLLAIPALPSGQAGRCCLPVDRACYPQIGAAINQIARDQRRRQVTPAVTQVSPGGRQVTPPGRAG